MLDNVARMQSRNAHLVEEGALQHVSILVEVVKESSNANFLEREKSHPPFVS